MMAKFLESCKYLVLVAVVSLMVAAAATFGWGAFKTFGFIVSLAGAGQDALTIIQLLDVMDTFMIGTVIYIFSIGLYELFVGPLKLPDWLVIKDLGALKAKLSDVIVLFIAIKFIEKFLNAKDAQDIVYYAVAMAIVSAVLIAFNRLRIDKSTLEKGKP